MITKKGLATFVPNKVKPVYNWFYYKEGFSRDLVMGLMDKHVPSGGNANVLDPFCGVGTTMLACRERGLDSYGFDVSPLAVLASRAKTHDYDIDELKRAIKDISKSRFHKPDRSQVPGNVRRFFNPHTLDDVLFFRGFIDNFSGEIFDFIKLGLITSTTRCSYMIKDGAVVKARKRPVPIFRKFFLRTLKKMVKDLERLETRPCQTFVEEGDARNLKIDAGFIDLVITSPPYLNKIEYTKVYAVEEFLFFGQPIEKRGMRAFLGTEVDPGIKQVFDEVTLQPVENAYFHDMISTLKNLRRVCKPGARVCIVVGDGCTPDGVIHVDKLLPELAGREGFTTDSVDVLDVRQCTKNRVERLGPMEEVLITFTRD